LCVAKVRYAAKCAGGCGLYLLPGTHAHRLHGGWWCGPCFVKHRSRCLVGIK